MNEGKRVAEIRGETKERKNLSAEILDKLEELCDAVDLNDECYGQQLMVPSATMCVYLFGLWHAKFYQPEKMLVRM